MPNRYLSFIIVQKLTTLLRVEGDTLWYHCRIYYFYAHSLLRQDTLYYGLVKHHSSAISVVVGNIVFPQRGKLLDQIRLNGHESIVFWPLFFYPQFAVCYWC